MDSTEKILDKMDGTQFEKICGPILQKMVPELRNFIPSGINSDGRVIKSLMDGFCFIEQTRYGTVHITTNSSKLESKWLYNGNAVSTPKGDLIKSINQAREMHKDRPDYKFNVYLVYSKRVDEHLHVKVYQSVTDEFIKVSIIEQRNIASFLDYDPEGQYLRKYLLGIDAVRISPSLLKDITSINLFRYGMEIHLEESNLAEISFQKIVQKKIKHAATSVNLLTGDSGFGKSTLCYAIMSSIHSNNGVALRLKQSIIEKAASLNEAIQFQLKSDYPGLFVQDRDIFDLFEDALVIIDDINKSDKPATLLDKIISWGEIKQDKSIFVLCPVWPRNLDALDNKLQKKDKFSIILLEGLSFYDCKAIIVQRSLYNALVLTEQQIHALIIDTGFDPLLIDFSLRLLHGVQQYTENASGEAIRNYISDQVQGISILCQLPIYKINKTLLLFGKEMLINRVLDPHLSLIEKWFGSDSEQKRIIEIIASHRKLFLFDDEGNIYFRHDRVRDHLLVLSAIALFGNFIENKDVLDDPYYAEIIGAALSESDIEENWVESLVLSNPLAVYIALRFLQEKSSAPKLKILTESIHKWRLLVAAKAVPKAIIKSIASALVGFDVENIQNLTEGFPKSAELHLARFRNGIWLSGVTFLSEEKYFFPEAPSYWWNSILAHVKVKHQHIINKELGAYLVDRFTLEGIMHGYTLVGFFQDNMFLDDLLKSWTKYNAPQNYPAYLWAILNSSSAKNKDIVLEVLSYWSTITEEEKLTRLLYPSPITMTVKSQIIQTNWKFSDEILSLLIDAGDDAKLNEILSLLFTRIDHPRAMAIVLNMEMQKGKKEYRHEGNEERWDLANTINRLSDATLNYLAQEFSNPKTNNRRRYLAWRYWIGSVDEDVALQKMQGVISSDDHLFEHALIWRVRHHDQTVLLSFIEFILEKPWLVRLLYNIWNDEAKSFFINWFSQGLKNKNIKNIDSALELLEYLDNEEACEILITYWEHLKLIPKAIKAALFLSSTETRKLAEIEIKKLGFTPDKTMPRYYYGNVSGSYFSTNDELSEEKKKDLLTLAELFKYLYLHYGIKYSGEQKERLTRKKIESLIPYIDLFETHSLYDLATKCLRIGAADLCYEKFYPRLDRHLRVRIRYTTEDLKWNIVSKYRSIEQKNEFIIDSWIEAPEKVGITRNMLTDAVLSFSQKYHDANAFLVIAFMLESLGTRKDIDILNNFFPDFKKQSIEVNFWKENAIFSIKRRSLN